MYIFRDPRRRVNAALAALVVSGFVSVLNLADTIYAYVILKDAPPDSDAYSVMAGTWYGAQVQDWFFVGAGAVLTTTSIVILMAVYRLVSNAHNYSDTISTSAAGAVYWHFVPIANLFMPYKGMVDTARASAQTEIEARQNVRLTSVWWGLWVLGLVAEATFLDFSFTEPSVASELGNTIPYIANSVLYIIATATFFVLLRRLRDAQAEKGDLANVF